MAAAGRCPITTTIPRSGYAGTGKTSIPGRKEVWYGKLLRGKPMFVALDLLPVFYALSENYGELDDFRQQFADGHMSHDAYAVYEALLQDRAGVDERAAAQGGALRQRRPGAPLRSRHCRAPAGSENREERDLRG